jgi:hypothetical protein
MNNLEEGDERCTPFEDFWNFQIPPKLLEKWSGRPDSNRRRPAWEVTRHSNLKHLESAGVGLESTEMPGKTAVHRERPLNGVQLECSGAKRETPVPVST